MEKSINPTMKKKINLIELFQKRGRKIMAQSIL